MDVVLGCWYYFPMAAHLSGTLELRPRGASPCARVKTMYGAQAKCCQIPQPCLMLTSACLHLLTKREASSLLAVLRAPACQTWL